MLIYPDTNIWNRLSKQDEDPGQVLQTLATNGATLVLSPHTVYELARTFSGSGPEFDVETRLVAYYAATLRKSDRASRCLSAPLLWCPNHTHGWHTGT